MPSHLAAYPDIKQQLSTWSSLNDQDRYAWAIQNIGLRYLRVVFLTEPSRETKEEVTFLLTLLIDNKAVDIDVLVDAFKVVKEDLPAQQRNKFLTYLQGVYDYEMNYIRTNALKLKEAYEAATSEPERYKFLLQGKNVERRSLACQHARTELPVLASSND